MQDPNIPQDATQNDVAQNENSNDSANATEAVTSETTTDDLPAVD